MDFCTCLGSQKIFPASDLAIYIPHTSSHTSLTHVHILTNSQTSFFLSVFGPNLKRFELFTKFACAFFVDEIRDRYLASPQNACI